jgi:drug/metabolite transporter (DMT)-like permease
VLSVLELRINIGDFFMLGSITFWSVHTILYKKKSSVLPVNVIFTAMMCCGVLLTFPLAVLENSFTGLAWIQKIELSHILGIFALNVFPSVLAYRFWNQALTHVPANEVAISQYLIPVFTTLISVSFLGEHLRGFHLWGGGLIFFGVFLVTIGKVHRRKTY